MICTPCTTAADQRAGRDQHCTDPGCTCGHRAARPRPRPARERPKPSGGPDAPPCKATIKGLGPHPASVRYCHLVAGHYDEADEPDFDADPPHPGGWHDDELGGIWSDLAEGATPHADTTED